MLRIILRVFAVLFLLGGLISSAAAGYLLFTPSEEDVLYEQKNREMTEKYEQAQAAKDPLEKARLMKESEDAKGWAKVWGEGARTRRGWHQLGMGVSVVVVFFGFVVLILTFVGRKAVPSSA
jgi:hypothetical protein